MLPFFRSAIGAEDKSRGGIFDPVTEADRGAEAAMRRLIAQTFPAHGVIGEEYGRDRPDAEYVWVLDPIDGTKSFISGLPTWGTLIGLMHRGRPVYGMMAQPFTRERSYRDGKRAKLRTDRPSRFLRHRHAGTRQASGGPHVAEEMRTFIGADSLAFLSVDGIYRAMGYYGRNPQAPQFTDHCFTGDYPTPLADLELERRGLDLLAEAS